MSEEMDHRLLEGQKIVIERLSSSYKNGRIGHAYIFDGESGTGKESAALFSLSCSFVVNLKMMFHVEHAIPVDVSHRATILT